MTEQERATARGAQRRQDAGRTRAEWVSLGVSVAIIVVVAGLAIYAYLAGPDGPPAIQVRLQVADVEQQAGGYYLPVEIKNNGRRSAEEVQVQVTLTLEDGTTESATLSIPIVAGLDTVSGMLVFQNDPRQGRLEHNSSFITP